MRRIQVTKEMIEAGCRFTDNLCPVARALEEAGFDAVSTSYDGSTYIDDDGLQRLIHSSSVTAKIVRFDELGVVEPFDMVAEGKMLFLAEEIEEVKAA